MRTITITHKKKKLKLRNYIFEQKFRSSVIDI